MRIHWHRKWPSRLYLCMETLREVTLLGTQRSNNANFLFPNTFPWSVFDKNENDKMIEASVRDGKSEEVKSHVSIQMFEGFEQKYSTSWFAYKVQLGREAWVEVPWIRGRRARSFHMKAVNCAYKQGSGSPNRWPFAPQIDKRGLLCKPRWICEQAIKRLGGSGLHPLGLILAQDEWPKRQFPVHCTFWPRNFAVYFKKYLP